MNLLIVDDEYYIVKGLVSNINKESLGIDSIFTAYNCEQAQKIIEKEQIDILLTDIEMPQGSGLQLIEWIQSEKYSIVPLVLTGHQRFDYAQKALSLHCFNYILKPVDKVSLKQELCKIINYISHSKTIVAPDIKTAVSNDTTDNFVQKIRSYINSNLALPELSRNSIAEYMHMNPDYLSYLFHAKFGQTLSSYIAATRINKAKELLLHTDLSLNEISERTGFSSTSYFHKQFKKVTGMTPQQYRSQ